MNKDRMLYLISKRNRLREQFNGLEAIVELSEEDKNDSSPMDQVEETEPQNDTTSPIEDDSTSNPTTDDETAPEDPVEDGMDFEEPVDEDGGDMGDTADTDTTTDEEPAPEPDVETEIPDVGQFNNRKYYIASTLIDLHTTVRNSIEIISAGPSFSLKPVTLDELDELANSIYLINRTVNKEPDHNKLLVKFALAVRAFKTIINKIKITEEN